MRKFSYLNQTGKESIDSKVTFCSALNDRNPLEMEDFDIFFTDCLDLVQSEFSPSSNAISNVRGNWYEWLISVGFIFYISELKDLTCNLLFPLPNVSGLDHYSLYVDDIYKYIRDLREKTEKLGVSLISSNPDYIIISRELGFRIPNITRINEETISEIEGYYRLYLNKCGLKDIIGFASVKSSLRPDRRLQLSHEGTLVKAFYEHLKSRLWETEAIGLKFYCCSMNVLQPDINALKTVSTHSILSVNTKPERAVDYIQKVSNGSELKLFFDRIILQE